jgi:MFS family permease
MRRVLAVRDARIFLAGWALSVFGDWAMFIVLGVWAKDLTGSNSAAGLVFFFLAAPSLFSPLAGVLVDRLSRRKVMLWTYVAEAVAVLSLLFVHDRGDIWLVYAVTLFYGAAGTVAGSARSALMTVILPRDLLAEANGIFQTVREGLRLVAPLVGAGIYAATGGGAVAVLDAASFVAVVIALLFLRTPEPRFEREEHHFITEVLAGARHIFGTPALKQIILTCGVCLLVVGFSETIIFAVLDQGLHRPTSFFGVLSSLQGVGAIVGGVTAARVLRRFGDATLVGLGMALFAIGDLSFVDPDAHAGSVARTCVLGGRHDHQHAADGVDRARRRADRGGRLPRSRRRRSRRDVLVRDLPRDAPDRAGHCSSCFCSDAEPEPTSAFSFASS